MAVPNTDSFDIFDVITELGISLGSSLQNCFNNAVDGDFDPLYKGSKNSLLNFRNYSKTTTASISPTQATRTSSAGSFTVTITSSTTWTVTDDSSWITFSPSSGSGNAFLTVSVTANNTGVERFGTVTVSFGGGQGTRQVEIVQAG